MCVQRRRHLVDAESTEQRATRLYHHGHPVGCRVSGTNRLYNKMSSWAAESVEERAARLQQVSTTQRERRAAESVEQRAARLQQMSTTQSERRGCRVSGTKEAKLQQMSTTQKDGLLSQRNKEQPGYNK